MPDGKIVTCDSSPIIWLAKASRLHLLRDLYEEINIPDRVHKEILQGESADVIILKNAVEEGWIRVHDLEYEGISELLEVSGIHSGEAEAILLAKKLGGILVVDDMEASATARVFGIRPLGTVGVLLKGIADELLSFTEFEEALNNMIDLGFRLSVEVYRKAMEYARELSDELNHKP